MKRRDFPKTGAAAAGAAGLAAPRIASAQSARVLRFVPQANLSTLDAVAGTQHAVRNAALLVWDTLYGVDANLQPGPQMCAGHEVGADGLTWTFRLRPGLKFDDNEPVASLNRASFDNVTYAPTGFFLQHQAWRTSLSGVVKAPFPVFRGVRKT